MVDSSFEHTSVLLDECLEALNIDPAGIYVDCTLGLGGHSLEIVKRLTTGKLIAFDKDINAIEFAKQRLKDYEKNIIFVNSDFMNIKAELAELNIVGVNGILADLGVSSYQIDTPSRGFSYMHDAKLDMRMNQSQKLSAWDVVNTYSEKELADVIYLYGEERFSRRIAKNIVDIRKIKTIETTLQLVDIIEKSIPRKLHGKGSVAKKTFQAIRIEVNGELANLEKAVEDMIDCLAPNGRLAIITFHSLEDRVVKSIFKHQSTNCVCDISLPVCICNHRATIKKVSGKPIIASQEELAINKRSHSAKLRVSEKLN